VIEQERVAAKVGHGLLLLQIKSHHKDTKDTKKCEEMVGVQCA